MKKLFGFVMIFWLVLNLVGCKVSAKNDSTEDVVNEDSKTEKYSNEYLAVSII